MSAQWHVRPELIPVSLAQSNLQEHLYSPLDGMLVHAMVILSIKFAGTHLCTWMKRGATRVKCLAQEHNAVPQPVFEPGLLDAKSSMLIIRPWCLATLDSAFIRTQQKAFMTNNCNLR